MDTQQNTAGFRQNGRNFKFIRFLIVMFAFCLSLPIMSAIMSTYVFASPIEIDIANFPDAVFREYVRENFDTSPADNMLSADEMDSVESIQLQPGTCASLQGIEFFPNLRSLNCADNQLTELDLGNNPSLSSVNVNNNQLTSLNMGNNSSLGWLDASNNHLLYVEGLPGSTAADLYNQTVAILVNADSENPDSYVSDNAYLFDDTPSIVFSYSSVSYDSITGRFTVPYWWLENPIDFWTYGYNTSTTRGIITFNESNVEINETNFPDPVFREYVRGASIDLNGDGRLSSSEANYVWSIDIPSGSGCASLQGIEFFPRLEGIFCRDNQLRSLDASNNPALIWLDCSNNQLDSIDLSNNPLLGTLSLSDNQLTSLDLSGNTALTQLDCANNQLTSLNVNNNPSLVWLNVPTNHLLYVEGLSNGTSANLYNQTVAILVNADSENPGSYVSDNAYIFDDSFSISFYSSDASYDSVTGRFMVSDWSLGYPIGFHTYNDMNILTDGTITFDETSVEINETNFPDAVFRSYVSEPFIDFNGDGRLSSHEANSVWFIDIPDDSGCSSLQGIEFFPLMYGITCCDNQLTSLDLSGNPALTYLDLSGNRLTSLDVSDNPELSWLECINNQLTSLNVSNNPVLTHLECTDNQLVSLDLNGSPELTWLVCTNNQLTSLDVSNNLALMTLYAANNQLLYVEGLRSDTYADLSDQTVIVLVHRNPEPGYGNYRLSDSTYSFGTGVISTSSINAYYVTAANASYPAAAERFEVYYTELDRPIEFNTYNRDTTYGWLWRQAYGTITFTESAQDGIPIDDEHFPDWSFREYVHTAFDLDNDYWLLPSEAEAVTEISTSGGYYDMTGIEYFPELRVLEMGYAGSLYSLDVSSNPKLERISVSYGYLTSFDSSGNPKLTYLDLTSNRLTSLDVSASPELEYLNCYSNQLTSLDVSASHALEYLNCYNNQLTSLDVSANLELKYLNCSSNPLASLDISKNDKLEELSCGGNPLGSNWPLASLDVSNNPELRVLTCSYGQLTSLNVSNNPELEVLACAYNHLTSLDVSKNPKLWSLHCFDNQLTSLDVSNNLELEYLYCDNNDLTLIDVSKNLKLLSLGFDNNSVASVDVSHNSQLRRLYCASNGLASLDVSHNPDLEILNCPNNQLTSLDVSSNSALGDLTCYNNQLDSLDVGSNPKLSYLSCDNNPLASLDVRHNPDLETLSCSNNQLSFLDISGNPKLTGLYCYDNNLATLDVSNNPLLRWLRCYDNQLLDVVGLASSVTNVSMESQTITVPVFADSDNPGSYLSAAAYLFGTHTITLDGGVASHDTAAGRFITTEINTPIGFVTSIDGLYEVSGTIVFEGEPSPTTYTVTFVDWDDAVIATRTVTKGASAIAPTSPERPGYTFTGWDRPFANITSDLTVKALYEPLPTYTVVFAPGEHGAFVATSTPGLYAGDATPQAPQPTAESGWRFVGWLPLVEITVSGDVTYTAQWERIAYVVTFVDFDDRVLLTETVFEGDDATAPVPPHRGGYIFTGWDTGFTNVTLDLTVKALYIATHAVAFYPGDHGTFPVAFVEFIPEGDPTPAPPWQPTGEPGWRFVGWYPELAPTVTEDTGYIAQWEPVVVYPTTYTVTFVDFDDAVIVTRTVTEGASAIAPAPPERPGYAFTSWDVSFDNVTSDLTVKALYEPLPTYTVAFDYGTHALFPILEVVDFIPEGSPTPQAPQPAAQSGWRFAGWLPALAATVTQSVTYTAQWERITHTVTFVNFDDAALFTTTVAHGTDATAPLPPARPGYAFTGWDTAFTNVTSDLTVRALYEPLPTHTVTFTPGAHGTFATSVNPGLHVGDLTPQAPQPAGESGWRFIGWQPALAPTVTGDATYAAQWEQITYTVTFVDSDGTVLLAQTVSDGASAIAPVPPVRAGYAFVGWDRAFDSVTSDLTVTALYTPLPTYAVAFDPGSHGAFAAQSTSGLYAGDRTPQAPRPDAESGWLFVGWQPALATTVTQSVTYTAQWEPAPAPPVAPAAHTVTFDPGTHGAFVAQITTGLSAGAVTPVAPQPAPQPGFRFIGWLPAFSPYVSGDVVYVAQWEPEGVPPDIATPTPAPTPPAPPAPVAPPTVIVNTPSAETAPDQYITVPAPDSSTGQTPSTSAGTGTGSSGTGTTGTDTGGSSSATGTTGTQQGQTLPDDQAPLADGATDGATGTNVLLFVLALVFLACLFGAGCLYMIRTKR